MSKIVPTEKARQGSWGRPVLIVLVVALVLAMVAWAGVEIYGQMIQTDDTVQSLQDDPQESAAPDSAR